jgi:ubiquitin
MQIIIKTLNGQIITLDVEPTESIDSVKHKIQDNDCYPYYQQQLLVVNTKKILKDGMFLSDYDIQDGCIIHLVWRIHQTIDQYNQLKSSNENNTSSIVQRIKSYLDKNAIPSHKTNKILNIINLMNYLYTQPEFIQKNPKFKIIVINKLNSLKNEISSDIPPSLINHFNNTLNRLNHILNN